MLHVKHFFRKPGKRQTLRAYAPVLARVSEVLQRVLNDEPLGGRSGTQSGIGDDKAGGRQALLLRNAADQQGARQVNRVSRAQRMRLEDPTGLVDDGLGDGDQPGSAAQSGR